MRILPIKPELFQTGSCYVSQFQLSLFRSSTGLTAFGNVLHSRACSLLHLVMSTALFTDIGVTKADCDIKDQLCQLKAF